MRTRITGLVQLRSGDAIKGVISRRAFMWRFLRVDQAVALSAADPEHPAGVDGVVWVPRENIAFVQEILKVEA